MDKESWATILNKINSEINDTEKTIIGLQGMLIGLNKAKENIVASLRALEEQEKIKVKKVK